MTPTLATDSVVSLRPTEESDLAFLYSVYAQTREDIAAAPWSDRQKQQLLRLQFRAQQQDYRQRFPDAELDVILLDDVAIGQVYLDRNARGHHLIDISLLPEYRGRGIGARIIEAILRDAAAAEKPVRLRVGPDNPALNLYHRLGFRRIDDERTHWHLEWSPSRSGEVVFS